MLKAALEALKKNDKPTQVPLAQQTKQDAQIPLDSEEDELMGLLDEISNIAPPSIMPTQRLMPSIKQTQKSLVPALLPIRETPAPSSSSLFGEDEEVPIDVSAPPSLQTISKRPVIGESPALHKDIIVPNVTSSLERLPFPIAPDCFTADCFLTNINTLPIPDAQSRVPLAQITQLDRFAKVPLAIGILVSIEQPTGRDLLLRISDETGQCLVTVHDQVQREFRKRLHYGMMIVLADCSIFRPSPKDQCLIAVPRNIRHLISNLFET